MIAAIVNCLVILFGGAIGILFGKKIKSRYSETIFSGLALVVCVIGIMSAVKTNNVLHIIICLVIGTIIGEALNIESRLDDLGEFLKRKIVKGDDSSKFTEAFVTASLLFCVGSMAIMGSLNAGINKDYSIIFSKSVIDGITAITFASTMGIGVLFSGIIVLFYQGALTLLAGWIAPYLSAAVIAEMTAIGGCMLIAMSFNMLNLGKHIRIANMIPAIFLPIVYIPIVNILMGLPN